MHFVRLACQRTSFPNLAAFSGLLNPFYTLKTVSGNHTILQIACWEVSFNLISGIIIRAGQMEWKGRREMKDTGELIKDLKHKDSSVRRHAIEMLGIIGDEKAVDALILVLKDRDRFVRQEAVTALGKIGGGRLVQPLTQALEEEKDEFVIDFIKKVLEKLRQ